MGEGSRADSEGIHSSSEDRRPGSTYRLAGNCVSRWEAARHADRSLIRGRRILFQHWTQDPQSQEHRANPSSVITIATDDFDIVIQGPARRIVDTAHLQRVA